MLSATKRLFRFNQTTLWAVLFAVLVPLRMAQVLFYLGPMDHLFSDALRHLDNGRHFLVPSPMGCVNAYFYQLFLYIVVTVTKEQRFFMNLVNAVLCGVYPYIWYRLALSLKFRRLNALRFGVLLSILPTHTVVFQYFMTETLLLPLLGLALWATVVAAQRRSWWRFLLAVAIWTCTMLTRSIVGPVGMIVLAYALHRQPDRPLLRRPFVGLVGAALMSLGIWIAAQHSLRILEYATPAGDTMSASITMASGAHTVEIVYTKKKHYTYNYIFSSPSYYISPFYPFYDWKTIRTKKFRFVIDIDQKGADLKKLYWEQLKLNRHLLPRFIYENLIFLTFGHHWPQSGTHSWVGKLCLHERWIWLPILLASIIGSVVFMIRRRRLYFAPVVAILGTGALYSAQLAVMEGRYRSPIEPLLLLALFAVCNARWPRRAR